LKQFSISCSQFDAPKFGFDVGADGCAASRRKASISGQSGAPNRFPMDPAR
jgi:hypothetical protein